MIAVTKGKPIYYAAGEPIIVTGIIEVGGTVVTGLKTVTSESEEEFLTATQGKAKDYRPLAVGVSVEKGEIYSYKDSLVICKVSCVIDKEPDKLPDIFTVKKVETKK